MTDAASSDFRQPHRYVRLDTILRLRWLAVLGQLAAIFIVAQDWNSTFLQVVPRVTNSLSALINLALQIAFNPMQRLEPVHAAALLALNIVELAGLLPTGGLQNPSRFLLRAGPDLGDGPAGPVDDSTRLLRGRLRVGAGVLSSAIAVGGRGSAGAAADLPARRLAFDPARDRRYQPLRVPGHRGGAKTLRRARRDRTGAGARADLTQLDGLAAAAAHELGTPLSTILIARELEKSVKDSQLAGDLKTLREQFSCREILGRLLRNCLRAARRSTA